MANQLKKPDYLFEISWEVCNKVGGIHTVITTKAKKCVELLGDNYICVGPDVWRSTHANPEFEEDPRLFADWRIAAQASGLHVRIGRWQVVGKPVVILVDFTPFIEQKDEILSIFWEKYQLDSLTGHWDYIEPAVFGYGVGQVIESFTNFYIPPQKDVVAHFQEWMTGTGLLYLKDNMPRIAHVFTCHATVLGRTIAASGEDLYSQLPYIDPDLKSQELFVRAKHSLEMVSAREADVFTTVSEITARECELFLGKKVDLVTPNGFELDFRPVDGDFEAKRAAARARLLKVAEAVMGVTPDEDALLVGISGRNEFRNKGLDLFIDAMGRLQEYQELQRSILAFILIPAAQHGPRNRVLLNLENPGQLVQSSGRRNKYLSHYLVNSDHEPILHRLGQVGLDNDMEDRVKVVFIPSYLDGRDGIVNLSYYETLIGLDYTVFPSYYEPWGYTPLESLAFSIPTITTDLAGFGRWVQDHYQADRPGIKILSRLGREDDEVVHHIAQSVLHFGNLSEKARNPYRESALQVSKIALWEEQINYYRSAYNLAIDQLSQRHKAIVEQLVESGPEVNISFDVKVNAPAWSQVIITSNLPEGLESLQELSKNIWWSWDPEATDLFRSIDPDLWQATQKNPIELLQRVSFGRLQSLQETESFTRQLGEVMHRFRAYKERKKEQDRSRLVAYFCMEYGLHASLKLYSGGLGVLAGDYLKQASDDNVPMVAIGLFYRYGYFSQTISASGHQIASYDQQNFTTSAAEAVRTKDGKWQSVSISLPGRTVKARIWKVDVGNTPLYLLDTDIEENEEQDRSLTHHLYGGDSEHRIKQEILLGIGGIRLLERLGIQPAIYHLNEGHAAFAGLERLTHYIDRHNLSFDQATEVVRSTTLFTTHTPVPAGHDIFEESLVRIYLGYMPDRLKISWEHFINLGQIDGSSDQGRFSMSVLACRLAQEINGVSRLHGAVSQKMFAGLYPGYFPEENHITYVTNGVHYSTWTTDEWREVLEAPKLSGEPDWNIVQQMTDSDIWAIRKSLREKFHQFIQERTRDKAITELENPSYIRDVSRKINPDSMLIGFARRFATYKRATLLFQNLNRLEKIVNHPDKPVTFIFAGKAHPRDTAGQDLIRRVVEISKMPAFVGKVIFLQNYDMDLARMMVSGVDIWLNTPTRPLEASGTSGQKVVMNGGLHFSVLDGWWVEGFEVNAGWALPLERTYPDQALQNELDADYIYTLLENEITDAFFHRNEAGIPETWVGYIRNSMTRVAPKFTTHRMLTDYVSQLYDPLISRSKEVLKDRFSGIRRLIAWRKDMLKYWDHIQVLDHERIRISDERIFAGENYRRQLRLNPGMIQEGHIGVELVIGERRSGQFQIVDRVPYHLKSSEDGVLTYELDYEPVIPGIFELSTRIYARHDMIPHRSVLPFVRWI